MENETASILKIRLEGFAKEVEQTAQSLKSVLQIVEESRSYANTDGKKVRRYLVALVKRDDVGAA
jgi:geranylgeranyl pyrophosphate synthase